MRTDWLVKGPQRSWKIPTRVSDSSLSFHRQEIKNEGILSHRNCVWSFTLPAFIYLWPELIQTQKVPAEDTGAVAGITYILMGFKVGLSVLVKCFATGSSGGESPYITFPDVLEKLLPAWQDSVSQVRNELKEIYTVSLVSQHEKSPGLAIKETCEYFNSHFQR